MCKSFVIHFVIKYMYYLRFQEWSNWKNSQSVLEIIFDGNSENVSSFYLLLCRIADLVRPDSSRRPGRNPPIGLPSSESPSWARGTSWRLKPGINGLNRAETRLKELRDELGSDRRGPGYPMSRWEPWCSLAGLMDCFNVACLYGQRLESKSFKMSPDWLGSDQWKPHRYPFS
jgi:hypothetical protein